MAYQPTTNFGWAMPRGGDQAQISVINQQFTAKADEIVYQTRRMIAPGYIDDGTKTYHEGEIVEYENVDYVCTGTTSGAWDSSKWDSTDMATQIQEAKESGGTDVEANPVEAATADLHKLKVDTTVYGIPDPTVTKTATGNPIEITDGADAPLVKCVTQITGYQSGSGTPSPDNIRPIVAYTEGEIEVRGKNLVKQIVRGYVNSSTNAIRIDDDSETVLIKVEQGEAYTFSAGVTTNRNMIGYVGVDELVNGTPVTNIKTLSSYTWRAEWSGWTAWYINATASADVEATAQVEKGGTATTYEPYTSTTHTTTYPSAIYRGSEDVVNGEVTTEWGMIASYAGETLPGEWISDRDEYAPGTTPTTGAQVAYELAAPTTAPIVVSNYPIKSLSGYNHIESSTGDMEVEYITGTYQPIVDLIDDAARQREVYSTDEQEVGTWVDGSKLYQKTYIFSGTGAANPFSTTVDMTGKTITNVIPHYAKYTYNGGTVGYCVGSRLTANNSNVLTVQYNDDIPTTLDVIANLGGTETYEVCFTLQYIKTSSSNRSLSKGATDSLKADLSEVKDESEEVTEKVEEPVEKPTEKEETER